MLINFDWFCMDMTAVVVVQKEELCVAFTGWYNESASLIGEDFAGGCVSGTFSKAAVSVLIV